MPHKLTKPKMHEMSLVFASKDGSEWAPRNDEAIVLGFKAGKVENALEKLKGYFASNNDLPRAYPVTEAADDIDNDGDGADDYNEIASALCQVAYDINQAYSISDDGARSCAIVAAIKSFLLGLDALRAGDEDKAAPVDQPSDATPTLTPGEEATPNEPTITKGDSIAVPTEDVDMTPDEIQAIVKAAAAEAVAANEAAHAAKAEAAKAEADKADAEAKAALEAANAATAKAEAEAAEAKAEAEKANADKAAAEAAGVAAARKGSAASGATNDKGADGLTRLQRTVKAQLKLNPFSHTF
jgi:chemotaxis protein histidine kinase CheA